MTPHPGEVLGGHPVDRADGSGSGSRYVRRGRPPFFFKAQ
jgi:hypothetical protein